MENTPDNLWAKPLSELNHPLFLGTLIATGRTAEIFAWGDKRVIKLTRAGFPNHLTEQEWKHAQFAWQSGARTPKPIEILDVGGRRGVVFERLEGPTMVQSLKGHRHRLLTYARLLGRLHAELHDISAPTFPRQHERIEWNLDQSNNLPENLKADILRLLEKLPEGQIICHGDFHPENIILTQQGPMIIDWEGCMQGSPAADVAATILWIRLALTSGKGFRGWIMRQLGYLFERNYLVEYKRAAASQIEHLNEWITVLGACQIPKNTH
jgi:aminoglycoside phosphotransferase (APT) family kinase protein